MQVHTFNEGTLTDIYYVDRELVQLSKNKKAADLVPPKFDVEVQCRPWMKNKEVDTVEFLGQKAANSQTLLNMRNMEEMGGIKQNVDGGSKDRQGSAGDQGSPSAAKGKAGSEERKGGSKLGKLKAKVK